MLPSKPCLSNSLLVEPIHSSFFVHTLFNNSYFSTRKQTRVHEVQIHQLLNPTDISPGGMTGEIDSNSRNGDERRERKGKKKRKKPMDGINFREAKATVLAFARITYAKQTPGRVARPRKGLPAAARPPRG